MVRGRAPSAAAPARRAAGLAGLVTGQTDENSHANSNRQRDQRTMFDLIDEAAQGLITELRRIAADLRYLIAYGVGAAAQSLGYAT